MLFRRSTSTLSRTLKLLPLSAAALAVSASTLFAQGRPLFEWSGRVDREVRIMMHGRDARTQTAARTPILRSRLDVATALPQRDGRVTVRVQDGRGDVDVVQQPSARNDYTAIVRIRDRSNGMDNYRLTAYWMPDESNGRWDDRDRYPNDRYPDRPRDRDDRYDRDRDGRGNGGYDRGGWDRGNSNGRDVLRWSGDVDDALEIRIQGDRVEYRNLSGKLVRNVRADFVRGGLPRRDVQIVVTDVYGRGSVNVVQQPSSHNNYTAVIRVTDRQSGYGDYRFDVSWRDTNSSNRW